MAEIVKLCLAVGMAGSVAGALAVTGQESTVTTTSNHAAVDLHSYNADLRQTSVSGVSSGAFMAMQFQVAHSRRVIGSGLIAGGPFYCAGASSAPYLLNAMTLCMRPLGPGPNAAKLFDFARQFARPGDIDPLSGLKRHKVYLFSGLQDRTVLTRVVDQTYRFLRYAGIPTANIRYVKEVNAGHGMITAAAGGVCEVTAPPFVNDCDINQAEELLRQIYGPLQRSGVQNKGELIRFDQTRFMESSHVGLSDHGFVYVPDECAHRRCRVHVALHGCRQDSSTIGDIFYTRAGFNEVAAANRIIVLYPQVRPSNVNPVNPMGCWDFWGYSSTRRGRPDFYSKSAPQIRAIHLMLERLGSARSSTVLP